MPENALSGPDTALNYRIAELFLLSGLGALSFHFKTNSGKQAHIDIRHPYQCKARNQIFSPVWIEKLESGNVKKHGSVSGSMMTDAL
jgi:hypothetical protein